MSNATEDTERKLPTLHEIERRLLADGCLAGVSATGFLFPDDPNKDAYRHAKLILALVGGKYAVACRLWEDGTSSDINGYAFECFSAAIGLLHSAGFASQAQTLTHAIADTLLVRPNQQHPARPRPTCKM